MREKSGKRNGERERERERERAPPGEIQSRGRECANAIANVEPQFCSCNGVSSEEKDLE